MRHAYLAFASEDSEVADKLAAALESRAVATASDEDRERVGHTLSQIARDLINRAYGLIVLISKHSADDSEVRNELDYALTIGAPVIPVRLDDADLDVWWHERLFNQVVLDATEYGPASEQTASTIASALSRFNDAAGCPVVALMNMKGGVGKTTVASQVFAAFQKARGNKVLLIDLDPQHNLSQLFFRRSTQDTLVYMDASVISLFEPSALQDQPSPAENWHLVNTVDFAPPKFEEVARRLIPEDKANGGRFDLICGQFDIAKYAFLENRGWTDRARANFVRSINTLRKTYDLIIIDTNPSASFLTTAALDVATRILAPVRADRFSIRGVRLMNDLTTRLLKKPGRPPVSILFNGVERATESDIEAALRRGELDPQIGFAASRGVLKGRLHNSRFLAVREEGMEDDPLTHLAIYRASGLWGAPLKEALTSIANELSGVLQLADPKKGKR